jgi:hypothetical protein
VHLNDSALPRTSASYEFMGILDNGVYMMKKCIGVVHRMTLLKCQKVNIIMHFTKCPINGVL